MVRFLRSPLAVMAGLFAAPALAADLPALPSLAADPQTQAPNWKGFYVGTEVGAVAFKGAKAQFGGAFFGGYDRAFDNNFTVGARLTAGYAPWSFPAGPYRGFDYGEADVKVGYEMGRLTPYVIAGAALARPTYGGRFDDLSQSVNGLFSGPGAVQAVGTAGVGFDYALTNNVTVGLEARVSNGGPLSPLGPMR